MSDADTDGALDDLLRDYEVIERGWSEFKNSDVFEVRCVETGEIVYESDQGWKADVICNRYNAEGPP